MCVTTAHDYMRKHVEAREHLVKIFDRLMEKILVDNASKARVSKRTRSSMLRSVSTSLSKELRLSWRLKRPETEGQRRSKGNADVNARRSGP